MGIYAVEPRDAPRYEAGAALGFDELVLDLLDDRHAAAGPSASTATGSTSDAQDYYRRAQADAPALLPDLLRGAR